MTNTIAPLGWSGGDILVVPFGLVPYPTYPPSQHTFFSPCIEHTVNYKLMRPKSVTFLRTLVIHSGGYQGSFVEAIISLYILWECVVLLNTNNCLKLRCICHLSGQNRWASKEKKNTLLLVCSNALPRASINIPMF